MQVKSRSPGKTQICRQIKAACRINTRFCCNTMGTLPRSYPGVTPLLPRSTPLLPLHYPASTPLLPLPYPAVPRLYPAFTPTTPVLPRSYPDLPRFYPALPRFYPDLPRFYPGTTLVLPRAYPALPLPRTMRQNKIGNLPEKNGILPSCRQTSGSDAHRENIHELMCRNTGSITTFVEC